MIFLSISVSIKVIAVVTTLITLMGGIAVWATWPEEKERMRKLDEQRKHL